MVRPVLSGGSGSRTTDAALAIGAVGCAVLLGWSAGSSHLLAAVGVVAAVLLVLFLTVAPWWPLLVLGFTVAAVPKAGFQLGTFPVPLLLPLLFVGLLGVIIRRARGTSALRRTPGAGADARRADRRDPRVLLVVLITLWAVLRFAVLALTGAPVGVYLPLLAWVLAPCLLLVAYPIGTPREQAQWSASLDYGYLTAALFAFLQLARGVDSVIIPGVTLAYGADYAGKNNNLTNSLGSADEISKIPSTYQSGNVFGIASAFFFALAATRIAKKQASWRDYVIVVVSLVCVVISGSRTALVAAVVFAVAITLFGSSVKAKIVTIGVFVAAYVGLQVFLPALAPRYSAAAIITGGGAGRIDQWREATETFSPTTWLFGNFGADLSSVANPLYEGWVGVLQQIGLVGLGIAVALVWVVTRGRSTWRVILLVIAVGSILDSTYIVFPTLFLPAARMLADLSPLGTQVRAPVDTRADTGEAAWGGGVPVPARAPTERSHAEAPSEPRPPALAALGPPSSLQAREGRTPGPR